MKGAAHILDSFEAVSEICGDPQERIFALLFERYPEMEVLFILDRDGYVRGTMLQTSFEALLDMAVSDDPPNSTGGLSIAAFRLHHEAYDLTPTQFDIFFIIIRDCFRDILQDKWTSDMAIAWQDLLTAIAQIEAY